jgi:hypothetical protein
MICPHLLLRIGPSRVLGSWFVREGLMEGKDCVNSRYRKRKRRSATERPVSRKKTYTHAFACPPSTGRPLRSTIALAGFRHLRGSSQLLTAMQVGRVSGVSLGAAILLSSLAQCPAGSCSAFLEVASRPWGSLIDSALRSSWTL